MTALPSFAHFEIDVLRTFVAICETGNFSRAAEQVHRTPSAISLQVKKLEDMLGRELFLREPRVAVPTAEGEVMLSYARRMLALNDETIRRFRAPAMEGRVRLGAPNDTGMTALPAILKRFASTHPHVEVDVRLGGSRDIFHLCRTGELDVAVFSCDLEGETGVEEVFTDSLVWIGLRHGSAAERRPLPLAVAERGCSWRAMALRALDAAGIPYHIAYTSEPCHGQIAAVAADLAGAPLPRSLVSPPFVRLGAPLPALGEYRMFMMTRDGADEAAAALATHVGEGFRECVSQGLQLFA